jgi:hypothetical protein
MGNHSGGISISNSDVTGGVANVTGSNNTVVQGSGNTVSQGTTETPAVLTQSDVLGLFGKLEGLITAADLDAEVKEEALAYLKAAKMGARKEEPKGESIRDNLENLGETLQTASKTVAAGTTLWTTAKPILGKLVPWFAHLGIAVGSFWAGL